MQPKVNKKCITCVSTGEVCGKGAPCCNILFDEPLCVDGVCRQQESACPKLGKTCTLALMETVDKEIVEKGPSAPSTTRVVIPCSLFLWLWN